MIGFTTEPYTDGVKAWLAASDHYLQNPPPGCLYAVGVRLLVDGLWGPVPRVTSSGCVWSAVRSLGCCRRMARWAR